jgi:hypothetical protein
MKTILKLFFLSSIIWTSSCDSSSTSSKAKWEIDITLDGSDYKYKGEFRNDSTSLMDFWANNAEGSRANYTGNAISIGFKGIKNSDNYSKGESISGTLGLVSQSTGRQMATFNLPLEPYYVKGEIEVNVRNIGTPTVTSAGVLDFGNEMIINIPKVTFLDSITGFNRELSGSIKSVRIN